MYRKLFKNCSALTLGLTAGRLSGMLKIAVAAAFFGAGNAMDSFLVAMAVPTLLFTISGDAFYVSIVRLASNHRASGKISDDGWREISSVFNYAILTLSVAAAAYYAFAPQIVSIIAPGFTPDKLRHTVQLARCLSPVIVLFPAQWAFIAILHVNGKFAMPALKVLVPNVLSMLFMLAFVDRLWIGSYALGILAGEFAVCLACYLLVMRTGAKYHFVWNYRAPGVQESIRLGTPILLCIGVLQINNLTDRMFASGLAAGSISALGYAMLLLTFPLSIVRTVVDAGFPSIAVIAGQPGEQAGAELLRAVRACFKLLVIVAVPSAVMLLLWRKPVIEMLLQRGKFDAASGAATAGALFFYSFALVPMAARHFLSRLSQSFGDSLTPLPSNIVCAGSNIAFNFILVPILGHLGVAVSLTLATTLGVSVLYIQLRRKIPVLHSCGIETEALRVIGAGGIMVAAYAAAARSSGSFILAGAAAVAAYGGALVLFGAVPLNRIRQCQAAFKVPGLGRLPRAVHK